MLKELWKFITNLGISDKLSPFDEKAVKLLNQLSFVMMVWFIVFSLGGLFNFERLQFIITSSSLALFSGVLVINSFGKTTLSKHYFMIFGLGMVTFVNMVFDKSTVPMVQFMTTAIFPILIFKKIRAALIYSGLNIILFFYILYYHMNFQPLLDPINIYRTEYVYTGIFVIMVVIFLISLFFRNIGEDLERKLVEKNRYLNDLIEKMKSMQEHMITSEKMASLGQLTAGIAHEINNPINFVSSNISPLKTDLKELKELCKKYVKLHKSKNVTLDLINIEAYAKEINPEFLYNEIETLTNGIEEGAERTKQIVMGLRIFSRIDEDEFKEADIHEGLESTLMLLGNKIKNRIEVMKKYGNIPQIDCIPGKINQVLMNVLNNASEAISEKGVITITTSLDSSKKKVIISLKDNGAGMQEAVRRRIFEPFYTTKKIGRGTGLGLSISYGIVEKHHGVIKVNSEVGKGSEFIITLPVKQPDKLK